MDLNEIQAFKWVAECGSFTAAAARYSMPKSTLSRKVSDLEKRLGVTLLKRTTRQIKLTDVGMDYLRICQKAIADLSEAEQWALRSEQSPQGLLRVSAPVDMGTSTLSHLSAIFVQKHPEVELEFVLDDEMVDLIDQKIDVAIRTGSLVDSSLKAQKLGFTEFQLFASPHYLKKFGEPKSPRDLEHHRCILFSKVHSSGIWHLGQAGHAREKVRIKSKMTSNSLNMSKQLALNGAGIALIPVFLGKEEQKKNELARVLKNWSSDREPVHAVFPNQPYTPKRVRVFLDFLRSAFNE